MYEAFWQLESKPFENTADPSYYFPAETHQGALLKLRYVVENRRAAALLTGGSGLGKSLLTQTLLLPVRRVVCTTRARGLSADASGPAAGLSGRVAGRRECHRPHATD